MPNAEFARGGATVNVSYKSGTSHFHGDVFEFIRNSYFDARNYFDPAGPITPFHLNQFGATLGGPLVLPSFNRKHDKTFFFFSYEGTRRNQSLTKPGFRSYTCHESRRLFRHHTENLRSPYIAAGGERSDTEDPVPRGTSFPPADSAQWGRMF